MPTKVQPPPPPPAKGTKGAPPPVSQPSENLVRRAPAARADLNFKVDEEFRRAFSVFAAERGLRKNELLRMMFEDYRRKANA